MEVSMRCFYACVSVAVACGVVREISRVSVHDRCYKVGAPEDCRGELAIDRITGQVQLLCSLACMCFCLVLAKLHMKWYKLDEDLIKSEKETEYKQWLDRVDLEYHLRLAMRAGEGRITDPVILERIQEVRQIGERYGIVLTEDVEKGKAAYARFQT